MTIRLREGRQLQRRVRTAKGQPRNPLTDAELLVKFRDCAARALPAERAESLVADVQQLETLADVSALTRLLGTDAR